MAEITKRIKIGEYEFELTLKSKSVHAHSLMTDDKNNLNFFVDKLKDSLAKFLIDPIIEHKEGKHL